MDLEALPDLLTSAVDTARATGDEKTASFLEQLAPAVGVFVAAQRRKTDQSRAFFVADLASRFCQGAFETGLDASENLGPLAKRAVRMAQLLLAEAERV